jgi:hypothetical protein
MRPELIVLVISLAVLAVVGWLIWASVAPQ